MLVLWPTPTSLEPEDSTARPVGFLDQLILVWLYAVYISARGEHRRHKPETVLCRHLVWILRTATLLWGRTAHTANC